MEFPSEESVEPEVVYEDEWLVAVHKPARMHSVPGLGSGDLCAWTFERYPELRDIAVRLGSEKAGGPHSEGGLLHRLDYETSGLVLFARKSAAYASLLDQQARGEFRKEYMAVSSPSLADGPRGSLPARGYPEGVDPRAWSAARDALDSEALAALLGGAPSGGACGVVSAFRSYGPRGACVACLTPAGKTEGVYRSDILACSRGSSSPGGREGGVLELRLGLARGFRHQIRAHLAWIGLPILGDPLYGGANDARLRLYAVRLVFTHPNSGNAFSVELED